MAHWLARAGTPAYGIEDDSASVYDLLLWPDAAITRSDQGHPLPKGAERIHSAIPGSAILGFITLQTDGRMKFHEQPIAFVPFSTYDLGIRPRQALCIRYTPPDRDSGQPQQIGPLPPRGMTLVCHAVKLPHQVFRLVSADQSRNIAQRLPVYAPPHGKLIKTKIPASEARLLAVTP
jgi:hypothetical protein